MYLERIKRTRKQREEGDEDKGRSMKEQQENGERQKEKIRYMKKRSCTRREYKDEEGRRARRGKGKE